MPRFAPAYVIHWFRPQPSSGHKYKELNIFLINQFLKLKTRCNKIIVGFSENIRTQNERAAKTGHTLPNLHYRVR